MLVIADNKSWTAGKCHGTDSCGVQGDKLKNGRVCGTRPTKPTYRYSTAMVLTRKFVVVLVVVHGS